MPVSDSTTSPNAVEIAGLAELYTAALESRGYRPGATHAYMRAVEHFVAWSAPDSDYVEIGEASIRRFLDEHLGSCDCSGRPQHGSDRSLGAASSVGHPASRRANTAGTTELSGFHHLR